MEYDLRKDVDRFKKFLDDLERELAEQGVLNLDLKALLGRYYDKSEVDILLRQIETGDIDLSDYVRKDEAEFDMTYEFGVKGVQDLIYINIFLQQD